LGFDHLLAGDFRLPEASIFKNDRYFARFPAAPLTHEQHFYQKGVAIGKDLI
jgi:hypothetical protein